MATRNIKESTERPHRDLIRRYFVFNREDDYSYCSIADCTGKIKHDHLGNLEKHLRSRHPKEYAAMIRVMEDSSSGKRQRSKSLAVSIDMEHINNALVELVTLNGRPLDIIDASGFRKILEPLLKASSPDDTCTLASTHVEKLVEMKAKGVRDAIREELKGKLLSLKVDAAIWQGRGFLSINVQFIADGVIHLRTLGIIELMEKHTAEYLQLVIENVLNEYQICISNIYSFTSDNEPNMMKLGWLLSRERYSPNIEDDGQEGEDEDDDNSDEEQDVAEAEGLDTPMTNEEIPTMPLNESESCHLSNGSSSIYNIRCAAHSLQLAVDDALQASDEISAVVTRAHMVAKALRKPDIRRTLRRSMLNARKPPLNVAARWNSMADMLHYLVEMKNFCQDFSSTHGVLHLTDAEWHFIEDCSKALMPSKTALVHLQAAHHTLSTFYGIWMQCKVATSAIESPLAREVVRAMESREAQLMENDTILASIYLDPRFIVLLPNEYHDRAVAKLEQVWQKLEALNVGCSSSQLAMSSRTMDNNSSLTDTQAAQSSLISDSFRRMVEQANADRLLRYQGSFNIRRLLEKYRDTELLDLSGDVLEYWESKKDFMPQLYRLATVVHAVPATHGSLERLFSGMHYIFSTLETNPETQNVDDIMVIRCNYQMTQTKRQETNVSNRRQRRRTESDIPLFP